MGESTSLRRLGTGDCVCMHAHTSQARAPVRDSHPAMPVPSQLLPPPLQAPDCARKSWPHPQAFPASSRIGPQSKTGAGVNAPRRFTDCVHVPTFLQGLLALTVGTCMPGMASTQPARPPAAGTSSACSMQCSSGCSVAAAAVPMSSRLGAGRRSLGLCCVLMFTNGRAESRNLVGYEQMHACCEWVRRARPECGRCAVRHSMQRFNGSSAVAPHNCELAGRRSVRKRWLLCLHKFVTLSLVSVQACSFRTRIIYHFALLMINAGIFVPKFLHFATGTACMTSETARDLTCAQPRT